MPIIFYSLFYNNCAYIFIDNIEVKSEKVVLELKTKKLKIFFEFLDFEFEFFENQK